ncbi:hypothetical protein ACJVDH_13510 [Pedobacter sp. AW1-32]|uniref:hypothetical protein n=1 Tax=Pedobacter sp. AW1-32 TaxID=3383026 RepID=UPI003FF10A5B
MRVIYLSLVFCFAALMARAQEVKPYFAILKTNSGKYKGILYRVDSDKIVLKNDTGFNQLDINEIQHVQIRTVKKGYKGLSLTKSGSEGGPYSLNAQGKMVDKWGKEAPSLQDEFAASVASVLVSGLANVVSMPLHAINPNLATFDLEKDKSKMQELTAYSIYYQANSDATGKINDIKTLTSVVKPQFH